MRFCPRLRSSAFIRGGGGGLGLDIVGGGGGTTGTSLFTGGGGGGGDLDPEAVVVVDVVTGVSDAVLVVAVCALISEKEKGIFIIKLLQLNVRIRKNDSK